MTPERWAQVKRLLQEALDVPEAGRAAWLETAAGGDAALRAEVESLLAAHRDASGFLDEPPPLPPLQPGARVGPYQIVQPIGEGGMGTVYQALREDIGKLVALKVVKRGLESEFLLARFASERRILAQLDHPNVTRFLDTGITSDGLPYFVMEFVAGDPIDAHCDAQRLDTRQRLLLFLKVCAGVEYAHHHLVVHRDLKPRNILVTPEGEPKLLDFGIAKIVTDDAPGGSGAHATITAALMMTPEYASPEQVRGEPVTTLSDVYSLGVLLYELLTGQPPYLLRGRTPHQAAETICQAVPALPSTAAGLARPLAGDLDNILMKALQKRPEDRYRSVEQLAADIRRHLEGRPVLARAATWPYRSGKFVRRHKVGVAAAAVVVATLAGGVAATLREASIANVQRARAERRFQDVRTLANSLLFEVYDSIQALPGSIGARELLVRRALRYLDSLSAESAGDPGLKRELAAAYEKVGDVQGGYRSASLGNAAGAIDSYRKALALREEVERAAGAGVPLRRELLRNHGKLSDVLLYSGHSAEALAHSRKLVGMAEELAAGSAASVADRANLASAYVDVGWKLAGSGDWQGGLGYLRKSVGLWEALASSKPGDTGFRWRLAIAYERTASVLSTYSDAFDEALALHRKELALAGELAAANPLNAPARRSAAYARFNIGAVLLLEGKAREAGREIAGALAVFESLAAADPRDAQYRLDVIDATGLAAEAAIETGDTARAIAGLRHTLDLLRDVPGSAEQAAAVATNQFRMGKAYLHAARFAEARTWYERSLPGLTRAREQGILQGREVRMIEDARAGILKCGQALGGAR
jgi:non-specific serine/threonine protein kinase/serine/threonine-protein kinase